MESDSRTGLVYKKGRFCGYLRETRSSYVFEYDQGYLVDKKNPPVSLTMPKTGEPYTSVYLFPCFDNLLPEGENLGLACHCLGLDPDDRFGCLLSLAHNCFGDIEVYDND